jgi:glutamate--cysteine ligase
MSNPGALDTTPLSSPRDLVAWIAAGAKPRTAWRIGTEHEKFGFYRDDLSPPPYEGREGRGGIAALLEGFAGQGWRPIRDQGQIIGLEGGREQQGAAISLEPGGQFELSGGLLEDVHATAEELNRHLATLRTLAEPLGIGFLLLGFHPLARREDMPWMPKSRYRIMRRYMPTRGGHGLDMMLRTATVQANLDFESEADMVRKLRVSLLLQPLATALFANSPFTEGRPNGFLSFRGFVWTDTDPDRTGIPAVFFEDGFGFERYVEWALDVPMYFIQREGRFIDLAGRSFRRFLEKGLEEVPGERPVLGDFIDHLTTIFTDVRLKRFLEMRGADAGSVPMMLAQTALWTGLLYDPAALAAAEALIRRHPWQDYAALRPLVPRLGLETPWQRGRLRDLAREVVAIAADGLAARNRRDGEGRDERRYLDPLFEIAAGGPTQAEYWLERYEKVWRGDVRPIFGEAAL